MNTADALVDSMELLSDTQALRCRAEEDGYLFFRGLLPPEPILDARRQLLDVLDRHGLTAGPKYSGQVNLEALAKIPDDQMRLDIGVPIAVYHDAQRLACVHRLPHHPKIIDLYQKLFGEEVLVHPRHIIRMVTAHPAMSPTPQHQDFPLIQGTSNTWTCWAPIGDCPRELGGLAMLPGSHKLGFLPVDDAKGAGGIAAQLCPGENNWLSTDYQAGDVLIFPSYTVHKALPCTKRQFVRLSFDVRSQPISEPICANALLPHCELSWDEIYSHWTQRDDDLKFYWQRQNILTTQFDDKLKVPGRRIC